MIEFAAVVALTGIPTRGGWYLAPLLDGEPVPTTRELPLPVTGRQPSDRGGEQPAGVEVSEGHVRIGWVEHLACMQDYVVARGFLDNTAAGRDHAGTLRLAMTRLVMEGETRSWTYADYPEMTGTQGPVCCTEWRITGASVQVAPAWELPPARVELRGLV